MVSREPPPEVVLAIYLVDEDTSALQNVRHWIDNLRAESEEDLRVLVSYHSMAEAQGAPWAGVPFIIAGRSSTIDKYFRGLAREAFEVLDDCAYFWVLTDSDKTVAISGLTCLRDRAATLSWSDRYYNTVVTRLRKLVLHPGLAGLGVATHELREDIARVAASEQGAWSPALLLGGPGTGKEVVARALWSAFCGWKKGRHKSLYHHGLTASNDASGQFAPVACGWFSEELLQDQLFGHVRGAYTQAARDQMGLLETHSNGCVLLDDFDAAPQVIQGALLRVMATSRGEPGNFSRLGDTAMRCTNAWLIFATNANILEKLRKGDVRADFIYRFEERVIHLRSLSERPADIPAIAQRIWSGLWTGVQSPRNLTPPHLQFIMSSGVNWEGNVRQLRALLSLAASMARTSDYSLRTIFRDILSRGDYPHWVRVVLERKSAAAAPPGLASGVPSVLSDVGVAAFNEICAKLPRTRIGVAVDVRVRLANILDSVAKRKFINRGIAKRLNGGSYDTAEKDLLYLSGTGGMPALIEVAGEERYVPVAGMFRE